MFARDRLYDALRNAIDSIDKTAHVFDDDGRAWTLRVVHQAGDDPIYTIEYGDQRIHIEDYSALARDEMTRIAWLVRMAAAVMPPSDWITQQCKKLKENAPSNEEFDKLKDDLADMPARLDAELRAELSHGRAAPRLLVPNACRYYGRLVGQAMPSMTVVDYINGVVGPMVEGMIQDHGVRGLEYALLCCSHPRIATFLPLNKVERGSAIKFYEWIATSGDPISRVGAVEAAFCHLHTLAELEPYIEQIVEALLKDIDGSSSSFAALSTLTALANADLGRMHVLPGVPPFYRRQAAIAQASLLLRAFAEVLKDTSGIMQWVDNGGYKEIAFLQGLIDLRVEPRFLPEYTLPAQMRAEIFGRLLIAGKEHEAKINSPSLRRLIVGSDCTVAHAAPWPRAFLPGPLEGTAESVISLPNEFRAQAREALDQAQLNSRSFNTAIEVGYIAGDVAEIAALASDALRRVNYLVDTDGDTNDSFATLMGLAILSSAARSHDLARSVQILVRVKRRGGAFQDNPENELHIALVAAAAFSDLEEWSEFLGSWITEIAFTLKNQERAGKLMHILQRLTQLEPALRRSLAPSEAALSALQRQ